MTEKYYDDLLNIKTMKEQNGFHESFHYNRYEPTPYSGLKLLFEQYEMKSNDRVVDFGCGKGRLNFFINYLFGATVIGIEMDEQFYQDAMENKKGYVQKMKQGNENIHFHCCFAETYKVDPLDNKFYFFNPFSIQIFMKVINNILRSIEENDREVELVLYYASEDYIYFLENNTPFELKKEIDIPGLFERDTSERFLVFQLANYDIYSY